MLSDLFEQVRSGVVSITFADAGGRQMSKGSGFLVSEHLVTNDHVFGAFRDAATVRLSNDIHAGSEGSIDVTLSAQRLGEGLVAKSSNHQFDYAVMDLPELKSQGAYQFELEPSDGTRVGDDAVILGYPFEHQNLVCHRAMISSKFADGPAQIIQIDASVNNANSGGPLINLRTSNVIGIVTRKGTGLAKITGSLRANVQNNIRLLKSQNSGAAKIMGLDILDTFCVGQFQILDLIDDIERSANVGIGYAFSSKHLLQLKQLGWS